MRSAFTRIEEFRETDSIVAPECLEIDFMGIHPKTLKRLVENQRVELTTYGNPIQREILAEDPLSGLNETTHSRALGVKQCAVYIE
tara:strand:+ start:334 stop:591 length:258 start_codon:yes stop_codon:yes gene_type:complete